VGPQEVAAFIPGTASAHFLASRHVGNAGHVILFVVNTTKSKYVSSKNFIASFKSLTLSLTKFCNKNSNKEQVFAFRVSTMCDEYDYAARYISILSLSLFHLSCAGIFSMNFFFQTPSMSIPLVD
jgi:hypothetical protein